MRRIRVVAAVMLVVVPVVLSGCGLVSQGLVLSPSSPTSVGIPECVPIDSEQGKIMTDSSTSSLDKAGFEQIMASCQATFDISDGQLLRTDVGLGETEPIPAIAAGGLITLRLIGSQGVLEERTDQVRLFAYQDNPVIDDITYFLTADTPEEFFTIIREGADAYGFDQGAVEHWIELTRLYPEDESKFVVGEGYALGFQVIYDLRYRGPGHVNSIIVTVSPGVSEPAPRVE